MMPTPQIKLTRQAATVVRFQYRPYKNGAVGDGVGDAVEDVGDAVGDVVDGRE